MNSDQAIQIINQSALLGEFQVVDKNLNKDKSIHVYFDLSEQASHLFTPNDYFLLRSNQSEEWGLYIPDSDCQHLMALDINLIPGLAPLLQDKYPKTVFDQIVREEIQRVDLGNPLADESIKRAMRADAQENLLHFKIQAQDVNHIQEVIQQYHLTLAVAQEKISDIVTRVREQSVEDQPAVDDANNDLLNVMPPKRGFLAENRRSLLLWGTIGAFSLAALALSII